METLDQSRDCTRNPTTTYDGMKSHHEICVRKESKLKPSTKSIVQIALPHMLWFIRFSRITALRKVINSPPEGDFCHHYHHHAHHHPPVVVPTSNAETPVVDKKAGQNRDESDRHQYRIPPTKDSTRWFGTRTMESVQKTRTPVIFHDSPDDSRDAHKNYSVIKSSRMQMNTMNSRYQHQSNGFNTPNRPTRSRSIAIIKRNNKPHRENGFDDEQDEVTERMYDWATWQMYNRIVDHRVKYPVSSDYESLARQQQLSTSPYLYSCDDYGWLYHGRHHHLLSNDVVRELQPSVLCLSVDGARYDDDDSLEGEIFDLEL